MHGLLVGDKIEITAANPSGYNGKFEITAVPSTTTISFALATDPGTYVGSAQSKQIKYSYLTEPVEQTDPATHNQLVSLQDYLLDVIELLQAESATVIAANEQTLYVTPLAITTTAKVFLEITVPEGITGDYFYQIYRTAITSAIGDEALSSPGDEMRLVYEAYPSSATAGTVDIVEDIVTDEFRQFNTNLYTNEATGDGILQANDPPPFAKDINIFKNVLFYANTRTRHRLFPFQLLGV